MDEPFEPFVGPPTFYEWMESEAFRQIDCGFTATGFVDMCKCHDGRDTKAVRQKGREFKLTVIIVGLTYSVEYFGSVHDRHMRIKEHIDAAERYVRSVGGSWQDAALLNFDGPATMIEIADGITMPCQHLGTGMPNATVVWTRP